MSESTDEAFAKALIATGPDACPPAADALFGQLVGRWHAECRLLDEESGAWSEFETDWIFAYTLGGRAVQDVLVAPTASDPRSSSRRARPCGCTTRCSAPGG